MLNLIQSKEPADIQYWFKSLRCYFETAQLFFNDKQEKPKLRSNFFQSSLVITIAAPLSYILHMSAVVDLRKVDKIGQKYKDTVFGYISDAQRLFPPDNPYFIIADLIKHLCLLYYYLTFETSILTEQEQEEFFNLLNTNNKFLEQYEWKLIHQISNDRLGERRRCDVDKKQTIDKVYGKPNIVCFFKGVDNNVCGGYTSTGWDKEKATKQIGKSFDDKAFIFNIRSSKGYKPIILNVHPSKAYNALNYTSMQYCIFGSDFALFLETDDHIYCNTSNVYDKERKSVTYQLLGGKHGEKYQKIEIFQLI